MIDYFGYWPSFHDAEIISLTFERNFEDGCPSLKMTLYTFGMTDKLEYKHCLVQFEFIGLEESEIGGFNHQNGIYNLDFGKKNSFLTCKIDTSFGLSGFLSARVIKVVNLEPLEDDQKKYTEQ